MGAGIPVISLPMHGRLRSGVQHTCLGLSGTGESQRLWYIKIYLCSRAWTVLATVRALKGWSWEGAQNLSLAEFYLDVCKSNGPKHNDSKPLWSAIILKECCRDLMRSLRKWRVAYLLDNIYRYPSFSSPLAPKSWTSKPSPAPAAHGCELVDFHISGDLDISLLLE